MIINEIGNFRTMRNKTSSFKRNCGPASMYECVFIYRTYHISSHRGLQLLFSEIERQLHRCTFQLLKVRRLPVFHKLFKF